MRACVKIAVCAFVDVFAHIFVVLAETCVARARKRPRLVFAMLVVAIAVVSAVLSLALVEICICARSIADPQCQQSQTMLSNGRARGEVGVLAQCATQAARSRRRRSRPTRTTALGSSKPFCLGNAQSWQARTEAGIAVVVNHEAAVARAHVGASLVEAVVLALVHVQLALVQVCGTTDVDTMCIPLELINTQQRRF